MSRQFAIVSDSSTDLPESYFTEHQVEMVSLGFFMDNVDYLGEDGQKIDTKEFYEKVRKGAMPTTHQVNVEQAKLHIEKFLKEGKDVLVVAFSSGLSGTANSFMVAAKELCEKYSERKVLVTDSLCASLGEGLYLDYAVRKADEGATLQETYDYLEDLKLHICHYFTVDDLFHLKRGGRVSAATAVVGTLLNIKPVLYVNPEGKLIAIGKAVGRKKSIKALVEKMNELQIMQPDDPIFISHGDCMQDVEYMISLIRVQYPDKKILVNDIGPVIGAHSGPGTLAVFFKGVERRK